MWAPLPALGWQFLRQDSELVVGEFLFRPGWLVLVTLALVLCLWKAGGEALTHELHRALSALAARPRAALGALIAGSALASAAVNLLVLGGHPHTQDEIAYLFQARTLAAGRLWLPVPPEGLLSAFQTVFLIGDGARWYGKYPFGWPLLLAPFAALGLEWLANPLLNAVALRSFHRLVARYFSSGWALAGTALLAASPFFVTMGASYLTHPLTLVLALAIVEGAERLPAPGGFFRIALGTGLIHLVRPLDAVALGLPAYALATWTLAKAAPGVVPRRRALLVLAAVPLVCLASALAYNAAMTGDPLLSPFLKHNPNDRPGFGPAMGTFQAEGHNAFKGLMNLAFNLVALDQDLYGWPSLALGVAFLGVIWPAAWTRLERLLLAMALLLAAQYFTFMGHGIAFGPRYYHAWLPALVVFTLRAGAELILRTRGPAGEKAPRDGRLGLLAGVLGLIGLVTYWPARLDTLRDYFNVLSRPRSLLAALPAGAGIVVVPDVRWHERELFDSYFGLNGIDLRAARPLFVRDGPWVQDGRLARAFPGRVVVRLPEAPVRELLRPPEAR